MVMDGDIHERGEAQGEGAVQPVELSQIRVRIGETVGVHFHIGGPALYVAAEIQEIPHRIRGGAAA